MVGQAVPVAAVASTVGAVNAVNAVNGANTANTVAEAVPASVPASAVVVAVRAVPADAVAAPDVRNRMSRTPPTLRVGSPVGFPKGGSPGHRR